MNGDNENLDRSAPEELRSNPAESQLLEIDAQQLLQGKNEVYLILDGIRYRLRRTRRNKLILQK
ncbi:MAG: hemin uptake protein HemP [Gemmataceae bacterium]|jgi:hemin uptake protein HemP|nr:hemin uptake protein HemP [Gemmataceae bacterium]